MDNPTIDGVLKFSLQGQKSKLQLFHEDLWVHGVRDIAKTYDATDQ